MFSACIYFITASNSSILFLFPRAVLYSSLNSSYLIWAGPKNQGPLPQVCLSDVISISPTFICSCVRGSFCLLTNRLIKASKGWWLFPSVQHSYRFSLHCFFFLAISVKIREGVIAISILITSLSRHPNHFL